MRRRAAAMTQVGAFALTLGLVPVAASADEVDQLAIAHDFLSLPRTLIVVEDVPQPSPSKGKLEIADSLGRIMTEELVGALQRRMPTSSVIRANEAPASAAGLGLHARFSRLVPGSRAKRFWLGFGAGKSITEISGEVQERTTGRVVARFTHARLSWCCGFGKNDHEIRTNLVNAAEDIADVLAGDFHVDQSHQWLDDQQAGSAPNSEVPRADDFGRVTIDASVPHAEVEIDGNYYGSAPLELKLPAGTHKVMVRSSGHVPWERVITVVRGSSQKIWAGMQAESLSTPND